MYTDYYALNCKPFENTPDPRFLFLSTQHREVLSSLIYGIDSAKGFILVAGDIGTGKTTLIHCLLREISSSHIIINIVNPRATFNDLVDNLSKRLGIESQGKDALERSDDLRQALIAQDEAGKRVILIIDEAHLLSDEALEDIRLLSNLETDRRKLIQIILVGQTEIFQTLARESQKPLQQRIVLNRQLKPLDEKETEKYIRHRLKVAGNDGNLFSSHALNLIKKKSRGTPRVINQMCDNALLIGYAMEARTIGAKIIQEVIKDMESGHVPHGSNQTLSFTKPRRAVAAVAICLLVLSTAYFLVAKPTEPPKATFSEINMVGHQTEILSNDRDSRPVGNQKENIQTEKPIPAMATNTAEPEITLVQETKPPDSPPPSFPAIVQTNDIQVIDTEAVASASTEPGGEFQKQTIALDSETNRQNADNIADNEIIPVNSEEPKHDSLLALNNNVKSGTDAPWLKDTPAALVKPDDPGPKSISFPADQADADQYPAEHVEANKDTPLIEIMPKRVKLTITHLIKPGKVVKENKANTSINAKKIEPNDWLATIARNEYGIATDTIIDFIHMANPEIKNVNRIYAGQKLILPEISREDLIVCGAEGTYHILYASFYNFSSARQAAQKLINEGLTAFVIPTQRSENIIYQVYVGIFLNRDEATEQLAHLNLKYISFLDNE